ncbi:MAG: hypothetical protein K2Q09_08950, partial [Phycisphaerales bacterium]|nr:hypothetical protein [Phycisphaerales bacterium]
MALHSRTAAVLAVVLAAGSAVSVAKGQAWANPVDGSWFDPLKWNPQSVPSGSGATAVLGLSGPYTVTTTSNTLLGVNITNPGATLAIQASQILTLGAANNTLNGVLIVNPTGAYVGTALDLGAGAVSFSGTGSVRLNASTSDPNTTAGTSRIVASGGSLTLGAGTRLEGFGMLQAVGSTNNGTFTANVPGRLLRIEGAAHQNNGLYTAANGGTLLVNGATVNQSPGASMAPGDGSWVQLLNSTVNGGSLVSTATARTQIAGGTLNGVVVTGGVDHHSNTTVGLGAAGLTLAGGATYAVNVEGAYAGTWLRADNASTPISGAGTVRLNASTSDPNTTAATAAVGLGGQFGSLIFSSGVSLAGFGMLQSIPTVNNGVFNADVNGRPLRIEGGSHQNNNLYTATAGGVLVINGAAVTQSPGAVISASGAGDNPSAVLLYSSSVTGGSIVSNGAAHAGLGGSTSGTLSGVTLTGQFDQLPSSTLYVSAPGITINGGATLLVNSSASYAGTWLRTGDAVTIGGSGTVRLNASSSDPNTTSATAALGEDGDPAGGVFTFGPGVTLAGFGMVSGVPTVNNGVFNADVSGRPLRLEGSSHQNNAQYRSSGGGQLLLSSTTVNQAGGASMLAGNGSDVAIVASTV